MGGADACIDWAEEDTELPSGNLHLWEESWDDDEQNDDFSKQLKCVLLDRGSCAEGSVHG